MKIAVAILQRKQRWAMSHNMLPANCADTRAADDVSTLSIWDTTLGTAGL